MATEKEPISITARRAERGGPAWYVHVQYTAAGKLVSLYLADEETMAEGEAALDEARRRDLLVGPFPDRGTAVAALVDMAAQTGRSEAAP